jgi:putative transposase
LAGRTAWKARDFGSHNWDIKGHVSSDHVYLFVSCPPRVSPSYLIQRVKGKSSWKQLQQFSQLNNERWSRHLWARGFFLASSGVVTDEAIFEHIRTPDVTKEDGDFRVEGE